MKTSVLRFGRRWPVLMGSGLVVVIGAGCGGSSGAKDASKAAASTTQPPNTAAAPLIDGTYALTGTQGCKTPNGATKVTSFPLFAGASMTVSDGRATVKLSSQAHEAAIVINGPAFHIALTYDANSGKPVTTTPGAPPGAMDLQFDVTGTTNDGGATIKGEGSDAGVNCGYIFTGRRLGAGDAPTTSTSTPAAATTTVPVGASAAPCTRAAVQAALPAGETAVAPNCDGDWATVAASTSDYDMRVVLHAAGNRWVVVDRAAPCRDGRVPASIFQLACGTS